jgi:hypothetical protein
MRRGSTASPVIEIACRTCGALPDEQCARGRYPSGSPGTSAGQSCPERAAAAASAR